MAFSENKKAKKDYQIIQDFEAGIQLYGFEVKAIKTGKANITGSYVIVRGGEAYMVGAKISPYQVNNTPIEYDEQRPRKLLLHKKEIEKLADAESKKGLTILVLSLYNKNGKIKAKIAIARHKNKKDKREEIKKRDYERELRRSLKYR